MRSDAGLSPNQTAPEHEAFDKFVRDQLFIDRLTRGCLSEDSKASASVERSLPSGPTAMPPSAASRRPVRSGPALVGSGPALVGAGRSASVRAGFLHRLLAGVRTRRLPPMGWLGR